MQWQCRPTGDNRTARALMKAFALLWENLRQMHRACQRVARTGWRVAPKHRFCATRDFVDDFCVSHRCARVFGDFPAKTGDRMSLPKSGSGLTQVTACTGEAARRSFCDAFHAFEKVAHKRNARTL